MPNSNFLFYFTSTDIFAILIILVTFLNFYLKLYSLNKLISNDLLLSQLQLKPPYKIFLRVQL